MEYLWPNFNRTRSKNTPGEVVQSSRFSRYTDHPNIVEVSEFPSIVTVGQGYQTISDHCFSQAEIRASKEHGIFLFGDCSSTKWSVDHVMFGSMAHLGPPSKPPDQWQGQGWGNVPPPVLTCPAALGPEAASLALSTKNELLQKALGNGLNPSWNMLTSLGELPSTVAQFRNVSKELTSYGERALSKAQKRTKRIRDRLDALEDAHLSYRFAWSPLVGELRDISNYVMDFWTEYNRSIGRASKSHEELIKVPFSSGWGGTTHTGSAVFKCTTEWNAGAVYDFTARKGRAATTNPLLTGWELLTLSFMMDRVIKIGQLLSAINVTRNMEFRASWVTEKCRITGYDVEIDTTWNHPDYIYTWYDPGYLTYTWESYSRRLVLPDIDTYRPFFNDRPVKDIVQLADTIALADKLKGKLGAFLKPWRNFR